MIITAGGEGAFRVQTGGVTLMTEGAAGEKSRMKPDIFLRTRGDDTELPDAGFVIKGPGEYELKEIEINGIPPFTYVVKAEETKLCFLSSASQKALDSLNNLDIVFVAENGGMGSLIRQLSPRLVVTTPGAEKELAKELGIAAETTDKIVIKKRDIPAEGMKLICLTT